MLEPFSHKHGHLWVVMFGGSTLAWAIVMGLSLLLPLAGYVLLSKGWRQVHGARGNLVTGGVYAFARHPQYTGLVLMIRGFLVQWPTLPTVLMAPVLVYAYVRLARSEEGVMRQRSGRDYGEYARRTPAFFPPMDRRKAFLWAPIYRATRIGKQVVVTAVPGRGERSTVKRLRRGNYRTVTRR